MHVIMREWIVHVIGPRGRPAGYESRRPDAFVILRAEEETLSPLKLSVLSTLLLP